MKWLNAAAFVALCACADANGPQTLSSAQAACRNGAAHAEIAADGIVTRVLGVGQGPSGPHEGFLMESSRLPVKVEDNVALTGFIPLRRGDKVRLQGQYECNDGIVHWTHRDPSGRHAAGFVTVNGRTYQ